jgi:hypothetical protein
MPVNTMGDKAILHLQRINFGNVATFSSFEMRVTLNLIYKNLGAG